MIASLPVTIKGIATALLQQYPSIPKEAMGKAISLLCAEGDNIIFVAHFNGNPIYQMRSSDGTRMYTVEAGHCSCASRRLCYHRIARAILVTRSANLTAVAFDEAVASDEQEPSVTQESAPPAEYVGPAYTPPSSEGAKRVQSSGRMRRGLTIRESMNALGEHLIEVFAARKEVAK